MAITEIKTQDKEQDPWHLNILNFHLLQSFMLHSFFLFLLYLVRLFRSKSMLSKNICFLLDRQEISYFMKENSVLNVVKTKTNSNANSLAEIDCLALLGVCDICVFYVSARSLQSSKELSLKTCTKIGTTQFLKSIASSYQRLRP